jgi:hypothetical protein
MSAERNKIFICYAHEDNTEDPQGAARRRWVDLLLTDLRGYSDTYSYFLDDFIGAGADWDQKIKENLAYMKGAVVLVSRHFYDSNYIRRVEIPHILYRKRHEGDGFLFIPLNVDACPHITDVRLALTSLDGSVLPPTTMAGFQLKPPMDRPLNKCELTEIINIFGGIASEIFTFFTGPKAPSPLTSPAGVKKSTDAGRYVPPSDGIYGRKCAITEAIRLSIVSILETSPDAAELLAKAFPDSGPGNDGLAAELMDLEKHEATDTLGTITRLARDNGDVFYALYDLAMHLTLAFVNPDFAQKLVNTIGLKIEVLPAVEIGALTPVLIQIIEALIEGREPRFAIHSDDSIHGLGEIALSRASLTGQDRKKELIQQLAVDLGVPGSGQEYVVERIEAALKKFRNDPKREGRYVVADSVELKNILELKNLPIFIRIKNSPEEVSSVNEFDIETYVQEFINLRNSRIPPAPAN